MSIKLGNTALSKAYFGSTQINKLYLGSTLVYQTIKAFPTAYGAGSDITGGRDGVLVIVNTLDPDVAITYDAGSNTWSGGFKDACNNATIGNNGRIIIFTVSGNIDFGGAEFDLFRHNVTILGQSAPLGGITLYNGTFRLSSSDNVIVRYLRCRNGLTTQAEWDAGGNSSNAASAGISVVNGCTKIILDHVSASWGGDKAILLGSNSAFDQREQTVQRCLLSDSHTYMQMSTQNSALYPTLRDNYSAYLNMFARGGNRTPNIGGTGGYVDVINNVVQSNGDKLGVVQLSQDAKFNWARNWTRYMGGAPSTSNGNEFQMNFIDGQYWEDLQLYTRGNYYKNNVEVVLDGTENIDKNDNLDIWSYRMGASSLPQDTPMPDNLFTVENEFNVIINKPPLKTAAETYTDIVTGRNAGACRYIRDDGQSGQYIDTWDEDLFTNIEADTMQTHGIVANWVLPTLPNNTRPVGFSTLGDGIEDSWRAANMSGENYDDIAPSGYTWLEEFYNQVDFGTPIPAPSNPELYQDANAISIENEANSVGAIYEIGAGTLSIVTGAAQSGSYYLKLVGSNAASERIEFSWSGLTIGNDYTFSFYVKKVGDNAYLNQWTNVTSITGGVADPEVGGGLVSITEEVWTKYSYELRPTATSGLARFYVAATGTSEIHVDSFSIILLSDNS